ncbi:MAG: serine phosphatase RsbU (regulator of sigma subunit) [Planctomycetota bacterium]|jgi:serine phosphatase RsbU (regulator of sigma subunit)
MTDEISNKATILAVDDAPENLDVVKGILVPEYSVKAAINGKMALKIAESQQPDLILLDVMMPEMDGYDVCRELKKNPLTSHIPVIFLTAKDESEDEAAGLDLGAADYISKPVNPSILKARVKTHLALKRNMERLQSAYEVIKKQKDRMEEELILAAQIQAKMVPPGSPALPDRPDIDLWASLHPAREVGGDLYDFQIVKDGKLCFCVGDVSGKGVPAALFMATAKTLIKARSFDDSSPASIVTQVNATLCEDNEASMFVTLFLGILDLVTGELTYTNAGHNPTFVKRTDGAVKALTKLHGPIVAVADDFDYGESMLKLNAGDLLFAYTDGVTEAMNNDEALYSTSRLQTLIAESTLSCAEDALRIVIEDVRRFEEGAEQADDVTILTLKMLSSG